MENGEVRLLFVLSHTELRSSPDIGRGVKERQSGNSLGSTGESREQTSPVDH